MQTLKYKILSGGNYTGGFVAVLSKFGADVRGISSTAGDDVLGISYDSLTLNKKQKNKLTKLATENNIEIVSF